VSLTLLEDRIAELENQDQVVKSAINDVNQDLQDCINFDIDIPKTGLLSRNLFTRAFTVWGHYFVASFIIGLFLSFIYLAVFVVILGNSVNLIANILSILSK
jgi:hypothetical protein